jgi:O-antigen/teichoic acid export membrane protein
MSPARTAGLLTTAALFCVLTAAYSLAAIRVQRDQRSAHFATAEVVRVAGSLLSSLWLLQYIPGAAGILAGNIVGAGAGVAVLTGSCAPRMFSARPTSRDLLRSYWRYGWPMSLWFGASSVLVYVDRFVIASLMGHADAGRYAAVADMITRGIGMVAFPITIATHSAIMTEWNAGRLTRAISALGSAARLLGAILGACVAATAFLGPWVLGILVPGRTPTPGSLILLAIGAALWQGALLAHKTLEIAGCSKLMLGLMVVAAVLTVSLDLALVPLAGVAGAAAAFVGGAACYVSACLLIGPGVIRRYVAALGSSGV